MSTENFKIKDLTEQELLSQLEEFRKKQKEMEEKNKDVELNGGIIRKEKKSGFAIENQYRPLFC